jgi:hypothetical protein
METIPTCRLYDIVGMPEPCAREKCALWENETCAVEQLATPVVGRPDIAAWLLDLRMALESHAPAADDLSAFRRSLAKGKE